ncbi:MAG: amino acid permease [Candidatus Micrarchaeota archaeon]
MAELKRTLGLWEIALSGVGIIIGAGIYALIGKAAGLAGNAVWLSFVIAALVAGLTGLSYAELSSTFPKAAAEYEYTRNAFGRKIAFFIGWMIVISGIFSATTVAMGFAGYFNALTAMPILAVGIAMILVLAALLMYGVKESAWFAIIGTVVEVGGLLIVIFIAVPYLGSVNYFEMPMGLGGIFAAASLIFFAFIGFEEMTRMSEEVRNPEKTMPKALLLAIAITTILYILVGISAVSILGYKQLAASSSPLADAVGVSMGKDAFVLISVVALFATANTVLLIMMATSRILYGMAAAGGLPAIIAYIHPTRQTPWIAIILVTAFAGLFFLVGGIEKVAAVSNFTVFATFIAINAALIKLRYDQPELKRPFKTPFNIGRLPVLPVAALIFSAFMMANVEQDAMIYGAVILVIGFIAEWLLTKDSKKNEEKVKEKKKN